MDRLSNDDKNKFAEKPEVEQEEFEKLLKEGIKEYREALENLKDK